MADLEHINRLVEETDKVEEFMGAYKYEGKAVGAFIGCIGGIGVSLATNSNEAVLLLASTGGALAGTGLGYVAGVLRGVKAVRANRKNNLIS